MWIIKIVIKLVDELLKSFHFDFLCYFAGVVALAKAQIHGSRVWFLNCWSRFCVILLAWRRWQRHGFTSSNTCMRNRLWIKIDLCRDVNYQNRNQIGGRIVEVVSLWLSVLFCWRGGAGKGTNSRFPRLIFELLKSFLCYFAGVAALAKARFHFK